MADNEPDNLSDMDEDDAREAGYCDGDGNWTDSGWDRATEEDCERLRDDD